MARSKIPKEVELQVIAHTVDDGLKASDVAELLHLERFQVYRVLRKYQIPVKPGPHAILNSLTDDDLDLMKSQVEGTELTMEEIATYWDMASPTLYNICQEVGIRLREFKKPTLSVSQIQLDLAIKAYLDGVHLDDIYAELGVESQRLYRELRERGIKSRGHAVNRLAALNEHRAKLGLPPLVPGKHVEVKPPEEK